MQQFAIEPLVDHTEEADPRLGNVGLVYPAPASAPRARRKMRDVDAAGERMDVAMQSAFGLVQAPAARQDQIRAPAAARVPWPAVPWGASESAQLVHAVVDRRDTACR